MTSSILIAISHSSWSNVLTMPSSSVFSDEINTSFTKINKEGIILGKN